MDETWAQVGGQDYTIIDYRQAANYRSISTWRTMNTRRKPVTLSTHPVCACRVPVGIPQQPGATWWTTENTAYGGRLQIKLIIEKSGYWQLAYFWYQGRDRNFTSEWAAKFYMVWDGIFRRRTDGALVRLIAPHGLPRPGGRPAGRVGPVCVLTSRTLDDYLP